MRTALVAAPLLLAWLATTPVLAANRYAEIDGLVVAGEYAKAARLLGELAGGGDPEAMYRLAGLHRAGNGLPNGLPQDLVASFALYRRAAELGYVPAQYMTGQCFERGIGVARDSGQAAIWYELAANGGDRRARARLDGLVERPADLFDLLAAASEAAVLERLGDADLAATDGHGQTLLMAAAAHGRVAVIERLLAAGLDPNQTDRAGRSALFYAAESGRDGAVTALVAARADPALADRNGDTPLHVAVARRHTSTAALLEQAGADRSARNRAGWSVAQLAEARGIAEDPSRAHSETELDPWARLAALRRDARFAGWPDLTLAAWSGDEALVELLATADLDALDPQGPTALTRALSEGHALIAERLIARGARPDVVLPDGRTALHLTLDAGLIQLASRLLDAGAPVNAIDSQGRFPLGIAAAASSSIPVADLLARGADPNLRGARGRTALLIASENDNLDAVEALLARGADVAATDERGTGAVWYASGARDPAVLRALLADPRVRAAQPFAPDPDGSTPLHRAAAAASAAHVGLLLDAGHDPDAVSLAGATPLHLAATAGALDVARLLVAAGAGLDTGDAHGDTPLHQAVAADRIDVADFLLAEGANPRIRNVHGRSPYDLATSDGDSRWVALFEQRAPSVFSLLSR